MAHQQGNTTLSCCHVVEMLSRSCPWTCSLDNAALVQEIAGPLEGKLSSQSLVLVPEEQQADNTQQLCLQPSLALWHALQR